MQCMTSMSSSFATAYIFGPSFWIQSSVMPRTPEVSNQKEISCAVRSNLDVERRRGRNPNWRRLDELRFEFSELPRSIEVTAHPPFPAPPWTFLSIRICPWVVFLVKYYVLGRSLLLIYQISIYCCQERAGTANRIIFL